VLDDGIRVKTAGESNEVAPVDGARLGLAFVLHHDDGSARLAVVANVANAFQHAPRRDVVHEDAVFPVQ